MCRRLATLSIFIFDRENVEKINRILSDFNEIIVARLGMPYREKKASIIVVIVDGTTDEIGALSGKIGNISGVYAKTAMPPKC